MQYDFYESEMCQAVKGANSGRQFEHTQCALNVFERYGIQTLFQNMR